MNAEDAAVILAAIGDSWPAALVVIAGVIGFIAYKALPLLKDIRDKTEAVHHETQNNSGSTMKDAVDRTETAVADLAAKLDTHLTESEEFKASVRAEIDTREAALRADIARPFWRR
ncbi:hypothetical protein [Promicromonospora sp. NFX87]|uniref:hypothetical protein n=1 Tax=Promicromonospora sp. NFX87 TaxID=3402691 RepID=UPI003AFAD565